jgi:hypothetical protein
VGILDALLLRGRGVFSFLTKNIKTKETLFLSVFFFILPDRRSVSSSVNLMPSENSSMIDFTFLRV